MATYSGKSEAFESISYYNIRNVSVSPNNNFLYITAPSKGYAYLQHDITFTVTGFGSISGRVSSNGVILKQNFNSVTIKAGILCANGGSFEIKNVGANVAGYNADLDVDQLLIKFVSVSP